MRQQGAELSDEARQERLTHIEEYTARVSNRLTAAASRLDALITKTQTTVNGLTDTDLQITLNADLADLVSQQTTVHAAVDTAKASLAAVSTSDDPATAAATAKTDVDNALSALRTLKTALEAIVNQL